MLSLNVVARVLGARGRFLGVELSVRRRLVRNGFWRAIVPIAVFGG